MLLSPESIERDSWCESVQVLLRHFKYSASCWSSQKAKSARTKATVRSCRTLWRSDCQISQLSGSLQQVDVESQIRSIDIWADPSDGLTLWCNQDMKIDTLVMVCRKGRPPLPAWVRCSVTCALQPRQLYLQLSSYHRDGSTCTCVTLSWFARYDWPQLLVTDDLIISRLFRGGVHQFYLCPCRNLQPDCGTRSGYAWKLYAKIS